MSVLLLRRIIRLAAELRKQALVGLQRGDTLELPGSKLKVHRFDDNLQVRDMTNAGKRGKRLPMFSLAWGMGADQVLITGIIDPILTAGSYGEALRTAKDLVADIAAPKWPSVKDPETWGSDTYPVLTLREDVEDAFRHAPLGSKIVLDAPKFELEATPQEFMVSMKIKSQRENQYLAWQAGRTHAKKVYLWLKQDGVLPMLEKLDFQGVKEAIYKATGMSPESH